MCRLLGIIALLVSGIPPLASPPCVLADVDYPLSLGDGEITAALEYLENAQTGFGSIGDAEVSAWVIMALAAAGEDASQWAVEGGDSIVDYVRNEADPGSFEAVQFAVMTLAIVAAGEDPYNFDGVDYVEALISSYEDDEDTGYTQIGSPEELGEDLLGILALLAAGEAVDTDIVAFVLEHQNDDGGWDFTVGENSTVDGAALAVLALMSEGTLSANDEVISNAVDFIAENQNDDGGFPESLGGDSSVISTAVVIMALHVVGEDPSNPLWTNGGVTPVEYLLSLQDSSGYFGGGDLSARVRATAHAVPALLGKPYPVEAPEIDDDPPQIDYSPSRLDFEATEGGRNPSAETLEIWNSGDGRLWWSVSSDVDWLSLSPSRGDSRGEKDRVTVSVDIDGLDAGRHRGYITIEDDDDRDHHRTVTVYLDIEADDDEADDEDENGEDENGEDADSTDSYLLATSVNPPGTGTIGRNVTAGEDGYAEGTSVTLTAQPIPGFAFIGWSGHAEGPEPTATVTMDGNRSVTAEFIRFDASGLGNVGIAQAAPDMEAVVVVPYPVEGIPAAPSGFRMLSAYVVQPEGVGQFALTFEGLSNADNVAIFRVVDGMWAQIPRIVTSDSSLEVTLESQDTVIVLAYPGDSSPGLWERMTGGIGSPDATTIIVIVIAVVLVALTLVLIFVIGRRYRY